MLQIMHKHYKYYKSSSKEYKYLWKTQTQIAVISQEASRVTHRSSRFFSSSSRLNSGGKSTARYPKSRTAASF